VYFACSRAPSRFDGSHLRPAPIPNDSFVSLSMSVDRKIEAAGARRHERPDVRVRVPRTW
jgi:hypothetical protein